MGRLPRKIVRLFLQQLFFVNLVWPINSSSYISSARSRLLGHHCNDTVLSPSRIIASRRYGGRWGGSEE